MESLGYEPWGSIQGAWFSSWYVISIDTRHIAQSPQSSPIWSPAFKMEPVLSVSSYTTAILIFSSVEDNSSWPSLRSEILSTGRDYAWSL